MFRRQSFVQQFFQIVAFGPKASQRSHIAAKIFVTLNKQPLTRRINQLVPIVGIFIQLFPQHFANRREHGPASVLLVG